MASFILILSLFCGLILTRSTLYLEENQCYQCLSGSLENQFCFQPNQSTYRYKGRCCTPNDNQDSLCGNSQSICMKPYKQQNQVKNAEHLSYSQYDKYLNLFSCAKALNESTECKQQKLILPAVGNFRNYPISINTDDYGLPPPNTYNEVCFYNNTFSRKGANSSVDLQVKLYEATTDYFMYVWYSDKQSEEPLSIQGTFQLNSSMNHLQEGFRVKEDNTLFIVLIRNLTLTIEDFIKEPFAGIQLSLFDRLKFFGESDTPAQPPEVPWIVIIVAGSVGFIITSICIISVAYILCKTLKKDKNKNIETQEQEEDRLSSLVLGTTQQYLAKEQSSEMLTDFYDYPQKQKHTVKVMPQSGYQSQKKNHILEQYQLGEVEMQEIPASKRSNKTNPSCVQQAAPATFRRDPYSSNSSSSRHQQNSGSQSQAILSSQTDQDNTPESQKQAFTYELPLNQEERKEDFTMHTQYGHDDDSPMRSNILNTESKLDENPLSERLKREARQMQEQIVVQREVFYEEQQPDNNDISEDYEEHNNDEVAVDDDM